MGAEPGLPGTGGALPGFPEGPGRRPSSGPWGLLALVFGSFFFLVVMVQLIAIVANSPDSDDPRPRPTPTRPKPSSSPTPTRPEPSPRPTRDVPQPTPSPEWTLPDQTPEPLPPPQATDPVWGTLQRLPLYPVAYPALIGCPPPTLISNMGELRRFSDAQLDCIQKAMRPVLRQLGLPAHSLPPIVYYKDSAVSPCGTESQAPAFYCSSNGGTIYIGEKLLRPSSNRHLWAKVMVLHEYGHHLQAVSGTYEAMAQMPVSNENTRRMEIQASCLAGAGLGKEREHVTEENYEAFKVDQQSYLDDGTHGSKESLYYWGLRGYHHVTMGDCNTWVVGADRVR